MSRDQPSDLDLIWAYNHNAFRDEVPESSVTYAIEGYSTNAPVELHTYAPYWGGFASFGIALRYVDQFKNSPHRFRIVKVTREVCEEI